MKRLLVFFILPVLILFFFLSFKLPAYADEIEEIQKQIDDLQHQLELSKNATTPLESEVKSLGTQLDSIKARLFQIQKDLQVSEDELVYQRQILARTVRNFYIRSFVDIPLLTLFSSGDAAETLKLIAFQQGTSKEDKNTIKRISEKIPNWLMTKKDWRRPRHKLTSNPNF